jgi:hypothetical protein
MVAAPAAHRAGRPLGGIVGVSSDALLRGDVRRNHLQQVELRGNLKQRTGECGLGVKRPGVARQAGDGTALPATAIHPRPQLSQGRQGQRADAVAAAVDGRHQLVALDNQPAASRRVAVLAETHQAFEPVAG